MRQSTVDSVMEEIANHVKQDVNDHDLFHHVKWTIVSASHGIHNARGHFGHENRQEIRRILFAIAQKRFPKLRKYKTRWEFCGKSTYVLLGCHR